MNEDKKDLNKDKVDKKAKKKNKKGKEVNEQQGPGKSINDFMRCIEDHQRWADAKDEINDPGQKGNVEMLKATMLEDIQAEVIKRVHKTIMDELTVQGGNVKKQGSKKTKGNKKKKKQEDDDEKEDEETRLEIEAKRIDKNFVKGKNVNLPTRRDNFDEMVKKRFIRKIKPVTLDQIIGGFD